VSQSIGESRVRKSFNPSDNDMVHELKNHTAHLIDLCHEMRLAAADDRTPRGPEVARCCDLAMDAYETAAMWAVKAATA
jgi:hypothetical protein